MSKQYLHIFFLSCVFTFSINAQLEMKLVGGLDTMALKQHFGKKIMELEEEKRTVQVIGILKLLQFLTCKNFSPVIHQIYYCSKRETVCWLKLRTMLLILMGKHKN